MLTIHGRKTSNNVQAVMWALSEMGIKNTRLDVGGAFGGNQDPAFLSMNPMGRVPVLQDGELFLFESQAILRYLAASHRGVDLWPEDIARRAKIDQWMEWAKVNVAPAVIYKVFWQLVRVSKDNRDQAKIAEGASELKSLMTIADGQIAKHGWLAGAEMTLADISFGTQLFRYYTVDFDRADLPNLRAYYDRLTTRPAYSKHVMVSYDSLRVPGA